MATDINTILSWFKTGLKPTQTQFWASWSSFWHKDEAIPQSAISNLAATLNAKAEKDQFDNHLTDPNAHAQSIGGKLDKGAFPGTAENLDNRIAALEMPDKVLKYGQINVSGLNLTIAANAFAWVLNQINFLTPGVYAKTITAATDGMYRTDIVAGNSFGSYELIQGTEASTGQAATEPNVPSGKIKVGYVLVFGNTITKSGNSEGLDLSGELRFPAYPNTRNDGQISMNKVLGTDLNGNLKMYTIATAPAPYLEELIPDSYQPSTTGNFILKGAFFTPSMTIAIVGQTVNYVIFISDNEVRANVTTGASEGSFDVTLNNGLSAVFVKRMLVIGGTVHKPIDSEWINKTLVTTDNDEVNLVTFGSASSNAEWSKVFDRTKNWEFRIRLKRTPLGSYNGGVDYGDAVFNLKKITSNTSFAYGQLYMNGLKNSAQFIVTTPNHARTVSSTQLNPNISGISILETLELKLKYQAGVLYAYNGSSVLFTFSDVLNENLTLVVKPKYYDWTSIKYIEF